MPREQHPLGDTPPEQLTDPQWRAVTSWRLAQIEKTQAAMMKAMWSIVVTVGGGLILYLVTVVASGRHP